MFELKVGDVIQLGVRGDESTITDIADGTLYFRFTWEGSDDSVVYCEPYGKGNLCPDDTVHRPTPAGLVQVWPEVVE